jgi:hypothetical protein
VCRKYHHGTLKFPDNVFSTNVFSGRELPGRETYRVFWRRSPTAIPTSNLRCGGRDEQAGPNLRAEKSGSAR